MHHLVRSLFACVEGSHRQWQSDNDFSFDVGGVIFRALDVHDAEQRGGDRQQLVCLHSSDVTQIWTRVESWTHQRYDRP